ncbi:MAG: hypothetical protein MJ058_05620 [Akkermansia sp.]|nr:hypothetical protein [Akkermansia sp.]
MKLRINAKLRAALIAAITAVGFTVTSAQAVTVSATETWIVPRSGSEVSGTALSLTGISCNVAQKSGDVATNNVFAPDTNVGTGGTWTLTFSIKNTTDHAVTLDSLLLDVSMYNASGSAQSSSTIRTVDFTLQGDGVNDHEDILLQGKGNVATPVTIANSTEKPVLSFGEGGVTLASNGSQQFTLTVVRGSDQTAEYRNGCFYGLIDMVANFTYEATSSVWKGTQAQHNWSESASWSSPASEGAIVVFDGTADYKTATVDVASTAGSITVSGDTHTFQLDNALTTGSLTIEETGALVLSGEKMLAVTGSFDIADGASLTVGEGASLKVASGQKDLMMGTAVTNNGTFVLTSNVSIADGESTQMGGTLAIQNATVTLGNNERCIVSMASFDKVTLDGGQITISAKETTINGVTVAAGKTGTLRVDDMAAKPNTAMLAGVTQVDGTLNLSNNWNSSFTIEQLSGAGTLNQQNGNQQEMLLTINSLEGFTGSMVLKHDKGSDAININTGTTAVNFNTLELAIGSHTANFTLGADTGIALAKLTSGTLALSGADTYTLTLGGLEGGATITGLNNLTLNVAEGTHVYTGALTVAGQITKTGAGSQTISGTALHHTILAQEGKLVLDGTYAIDDVAEGAQVAKIVDYEDHDSDNGFRMITGTKTVYSDAGTVLDLTNAHFTYLTQDVTQSVVGNNGVFALPGDSIKSTVYVTKDSLDIANYKNVAGDALTSVELSDGTTVNMDAAVTVGVKLAEGASATVNAAEATTLSGVTGLGEGQTLTISGTAPVTIGSAITGSTVSVNGGTLNLGNYIHNLAALNVVNGTVTAVGVDSGNGCVSGTISIGADGVFQTTGHHDVFGYNNNATDKIVMGGTGSDHMASLELTPDGTGVTTMTTDIEMNGYAAITTKNGFNTYNGAITATGVENSIDQMYLRSSVIITVNGAESELTIGKLKRTNNFDGTITKEGEGKLVFNGEENVIDKTITVNAGTLALDGTFSIGGIQGTESATYDGGVVANNGFKTATTTRTVYTKGDEGATVIVGQDAHFMVGEDEVQLADDGTYTSAAETDYTKFYVNSESEAVSTALDGHQPTAFALATSTTLQVDENIAATVTGAGATSVVTIDSDKVLTGTAQNVALTGAGTYALNANAQALGTGVTLGEGWEGTVRLSGSINNIKFDASVLGNHVEVCGLSGYFYDLTVGGRGTYAGTLTLTNPEAGTPALLINNGYSRDNAYYELSGAVDGSGTWRFDKGDATVTNRIIFSGDTADWDGALELTKGYTLELTFAQVEGEMGAAITRNGGTLNMIVGSASGQSTVFNQNVTASALTISEGATATFEADATFGSLSGAGSLVVDEGATLKITGDVSADVAIVAKDGAVIDSANIDPVHVGIDKESTATFEKGIAKENGISFSEGAQVTNNGGEAAAYDTDKDTMTVKADTLSYIAGDGNVEIANTVVVDEIVNVSGNKLTLTNAETMNLKSMTISEASTVEMLYTDGQVPVEGTVTITESLTAGGATLLANLTIADVDVEDGVNPILNVNGGGDNALTLGSQFGIAEGTLVTLDDATITALEGLQIGGTLNLIKALSQQDQLSYLSDDYDGTWFDAMFVRTDNVHGDYRVYATGDSFGLTKVSNTPEPTTGTLSLLALAALAARRRKHN